MTLDQLKSSLIRLKELKRYQTHELHDNKAEDTSRLDPDPAGQKSPNPSCDLSEASVARLIQSCEDLNLSTVHRPKVELDLVRTVGLVSDASLNAINSALATLFVKTEEFNARNLRSRQRNSYFRTLEIVPTLAVSMCNLLSYLLAIMARLQTMQPDQYEKRLKKLLCCCENIASQASVEKNKWDLVLLHCNSINDILAAEQKEEREKTM